MRIRRLIFPGAMFVTGLCVLASTPLCCTSIIGFCRGERTYQGRYTSYWRLELKNWDAIGCLQSVHGPIDQPCHSHSLLWHRQRPWWQECLAKYIDMDEPPQRPSPPLLEGDEAALGVLTELLTDDRPNVRLIALEGLIQIRPRVHIDLSGIVRNIENEDPWIEEAIHEIDPELGERIRKSHPPPERVFGGIQ